MEQLKARILNCTACDLSKTRNHAIWGEGNPNADILIIGEAPGADEDKMGRPFVGKSGQLLDKILLACGFTRQEHVFLSNILRCRPPGNRVPKEEEVNECIAYLYEQIELVNPKIIIPLGATALKRLLKDDSLKITKIHGNWINWENRLVLPVFHPAALLRNSALKRETWEDFKKIVFKYRELVNPDHYSEHI
ncbi:uracil-DNA glycosylase [Labilibaculum antarcticum]|uniref:Type-4 uracil-DNA glycosylase n=1 Tax=Labilibaculum antarcticum TaxID=1717717 RepID=A0A1Y1CMF3_9BACT|nr:uracil-DNA glycosylase [Labilibaculum antarcticum]BAX81464.1 uracil-DNA glycosylase [Labilibaculum antarcticum]